MKSIYIFKLNVLLRPEDKRKLRDELKRQIEEGTLLLDHYVSFVGKKLKVYGREVEVEFVGQVEE